MRRQVYLSAFLVFGFIGYAVMWLLDRLDRIECDVRRAQLDAACALNDRRDEPDEEPEP